MSIRADKETLDFLSSVPLLSNLDRGSLSDIVFVTEKREFLPGAIVVDKGTVADYVFVVRSGSVVTNLGSFKPGACFGHQALSTSYTFRCAYKAGPTGAMIYAILAEKSRGMVKSATAPKRMALREANVEESKQADRDYILPTMENISLFSAAVRRHGLFDHIDDDSVGGFVELMWRETCNSGDAIIKEGEAGDRFFLIEQGGFEVKKSNKTVATMSSGMIVGVSAMMNRSPRNATVIATKPSTVWVVNRNAYRRFIMKSSQGKIEEHLATLDTVKMFENLLEEEKLQLAEALDEVDFKDGDRIITQGEEGDTFYIIRRGEVACLIDGNEVNRLQMGAYFGARALLKKEPRAATITCKGPVQVLTLDRNGFKDLLGPLEDIMKQTYAERKAERRVSDVSDYAPLDTEIQFGDLEFVGNLGVGSYGLVRLVKHAHTGKSYALKRFSKKALLEGDDFDQVVNEKDLLQRIDHSMIIKLHASYKDVDHVYLLIDVCMGGDLYGLLRSNLSFPESSTKFYAACIVLCFEHIHSKKIIHRDLKPENVLINDDGYIKLVDFGLAKLLRFRTFTLCGTPCYIAPEMLRGVGHGRGVDWWTLGILIFELLSGYTPFDHHDPHVICNMVLKGEYTFPDNFSKMACDLIRRLLNPKPTKRLGVIKGGASLLKRHKWFSEVDWELLAAHKLRAPYIPEIRSDADTSNFDVRDIVDEVIPFDGDDSVFDDF